MTNLGEWGGGLQNGRERGACWRGAQNSFRPVKGGGGGGQERFYPVLTGVHRKFWTRNVALPVINDQSLIIGNHKHRTP